MTYIKINEKIYPASVGGKLADREWDNRESKAITIEIDHETASALFVDGAKWSIVQQDEVPIYDENCEQIGTKMQETEWDNSEFSLAGDLTDHRDGTMTIKMGKLTELEEAYEIMLGGME